VTIGARPRFLSVAAVLCGAAAVLIVAGCGGTRSPTGAVIPVTERDFHISGPRHVAAGNVVFRVRNAGPDAHEFIVVRLGPKGTPLRGDGMTVDEDALSASTVGALEPGNPGAVRDLSVSLPPGRYVFFCNMEGHFRGGMHMEVVVGS
jgi:hypothetical protein